MRHDLLLELTPVLVRQPDDRIIYWNRSAEVLYGFTAQQAIGKKSHELLQTTFPEPANRIWARLRAGRQWQGELRQMRSDGQCIHVASEWIPYLDDEGQLHAVIEVNKEITDRKQAEEALAHAIARFNGIINSAMDAIISVDASQHIVLWNPAAEKMFGVTATEAIGAPIERFIPERFRHAHVRQVEKFGETGVSERRMGRLGIVSGLRAGGEEFPVEASISQVVVGGDKLYTIILRDNSEGQHSGQALRDAREALRVHALNLEKVVADRTAQLRQSLAELEAFSYSLSHDLRAPLRAISSFTRIVLLDYGKEMKPEATEMLERVLASAERMDRLMQDVLAFSRVGRNPVDLHTVDTEKLVRTLIAERPELQPPASAIQVESPLLPVYGNEASLTQCVTNLLNNAVKFVDPGSVPRVRVYTELRDKRIRLWVEDNGIGVPEDMRHKLFEIFQRLHVGYEGTGIGLAIVKKAAERIGGTVGAEPRPGGGTRFWIELAAAPPAPA